MLYRLTGYKTGEEWLLFQVLVVLLEVLFAWADHLGCDHLVASLLESRDNVANESSLDAIRLDCNETKPSISTSSSGMRVTVQLTFARKKTS